MPKLKFFLVFLSLVTYLTLAHTIRFFLHFAKDRTQLAALNWLTNRLCSFLKVLGGIHIHFEGNKELLKQNGQFIIANHIGYLDGIVMGYLTQGSFMAKIEILDMILVGKVVKACKTIFIDSRKKNEIVSYNTEMAKRMKEGTNILIFPEGHCTDGTHVLPFYAAYFDAPLQVHAPILPVSIEFEKADGQPIKNREEFCFFETMSFFPHLLNVLKYKKIDVRVTVHDRIETKEYNSNSKDRKFIANYAHGVLAKHKQMIYPAPTPPLKPAEPEERELLGV